MQKISDSRQESHPSRASNVCLVTGTHVVLLDRVPGRANASTPHCMDQPGFSAQCRNLMVPTEPWHERNHKL